MRHGWEHIPWCTITDDFDKDFVRDWHGTNAFVREGIRMPHPPSSVAATKQMENTWNYLDTPCSSSWRNQEDSPEEPRGRQPVLGTTTTPTARAVITISGSEEELRAHRRRRATCTPNSDLLRRSSPWRNEQDPSPKLNNVRDILR